MPAKTWTRPSVAGLVYLATTNDPVALRTRSFEVEVTVSQGFSCGCRVPPSGPVPVHEVRKVGTVIICDRCDDYAVVTRVTTRMVDG